MEGCEQQPLQLLPGLQVKVTLRAPTREQLTNKQLTPLVVRAPRQAVNTTQVILEFAEQLCRW
jgi:hypothetical protein